MSACLTLENTTESLRNGFLELGVTQTWLVITATRTTDANVVLSDLDLPPLGISQIFGTYTLWPIDRNAVRVDEDSTGRKWEVNYIYSNNTGNFARDVNGDPVTVPTDSAKTVQITFQEYAEPIEDAKFLNTTQGGSYNVGTPVTGTPTWLAFPNDEGPVRVSTGEPVLAERIAYRTVIAVSRVEAEWNPLYETYTNAVNTEQVVITETDSVGTKATYTYDAGTLRMKPVTKQVLWQDAIMYFRIMFEMEHNARTWIHSEVDRSQKFRAYAGQLKPDGDEWTQEQVDALVDPPSSGAPYNWKSITTNEETIAIGDPVKLNGWGVPMPIARVTGALPTQDQAVYLNYEIYPELDYAPLAL